MTDWKHLGTNVGMFLASMLTVLVPAYFDIRGRIDDGKDEQRAHWRAERHHKDSCDRAFQDSVMYYLRKHVKK